MTVEVKAPGLAREPFCEFPPEQVPGMVLQPGFIERGVYAVPG